jgi:hypothetical protein
MTLVHLVVASAEEAADGNIEFWSGRDLMAVTVLHEGRTHLRLDPRHDGEPWLIDAESLTVALQDAAQQLATY